MAVMTGKWKAIRTNMHQGNLTWQLFHLGTDSLEANDVASQHPEIVRQVEDIVKKEHLPSGNPNWRYKVLGE